MKKFKDVAHLYLPFLAICDDRSYMVNGYSVDEDMFRIDTSETDSDWWNTSNFKPVMRRLSDLGIDDFEFLMNCKFKYDRFENFRIENGGGIEVPAIYCTGVKIINNKEDRTYCTQHISSLNPEQFTFLLQLQVDIFGLIESGEAIRIPRTT